VHFCKKPSPPFYPTPNPPATFENSFIQPSVFSPPSRYSHTARPGLPQSVLMPSGNSALSGGGHRLLTMSQFTSVLRSAPAITTRQGVVMVPLIAAGLASRLPSSAPYLNLKG